MAMAAALSTLVPQRADRLLLAAVGLCAVAAVFGAYGLPGLWLHWLGKPLATVGLLLFAARGRSAAPRYRGGVLAGLALSLLGDVLLMWPRDLFAAGLGAFLLAHFAYLTAFTADTPLAARQGPFLAYAALAGVLSWLLWPGIPSALHLPVLLYVAALSAMAAQAAVRARVVATPGARCAAVGAALFALSDASLAVDRFRWPFAAAEALVLGSYWLAQALIAPSVGRRASA